MIELNGKDKFNEFISGKSVCVIDFYAPWCGPCRILAPKLAAWTEKYKIPGAKVDTTNNMDLASDYSINLLPTTVVFKNGKEHKRLIGVFEESEFKKATE